MFSDILSLKVINPFSQNPLLFASEADQDLEFDESLEEGEDPGFDKKPPYRHPLFLLLVLVLVIGIGYLAMEPDLISSMRNLVMSPAQTELDKQPNVFTGTQTPKAQNGLSYSFPIPQFQEGQIVTVVSGLGSPAGPIVLSKDSGGTQNGPAVSPGDFLTILDGDLVDNEWIYHVHTKSGASGWIPAKKLQSQSSSS